MNSTSVALACWDGPAFGEGQTDPSSPTISCRGIRRSEALSGRICEKWAGLTGSFPSILWGQVSVELVQKHHQPEVARVSVEVYALGQEISSQVNGSPEALLDTVDEAFTSLQGEVGRRTGILGGYRVRSPAARRPV
jgi:hypothetical protein